MFPPDDGYDYQKVLLTVWISDLAGIYTRTNTCRNESNKEPGIPDSLLEFQKDNVVGAYLSRAMAQYSGWKSPELNCSGSN